MLGVRSNLRLLRGEWRTAEADARASLEHGRAVRRQPVPGADRDRAPAGAPRRVRRRARRSSEAWEHAVATQELQRLAPAAAARAEHAWLEGDLARTVAVARPTYELAAARGDAWARAELGFWLWRARRAGRRRTPTTRRPTPARSRATGAARRRRGRRSATRTSAPRRSCEADEEEARLEALATIDEFGAARAASHLRRRLRAAGVRRIPRGPRAASRSGPAGLTPRETEVLDLIVRGATNAEIAQALVIAPKTVDHHVSRRAGEARRLLAARGRRRAGTAERARCACRPRRGTPSRSAPRRRVPRFHSSQKRVQRLVELAPRARCARRWRGCRSSARSAP